MNAPFRLKPQEIPTVERPEFKVALEIAKVMGPKPAPILVRAWAAAMKRALR